MMQRDTKTSMSHTEDDQELTKKVWLTKAGFEQNSMASWQDQQQYGWMNSVSLSLLSGF